MAVTMADVARRAGTSVAVVSYVVNDGPRPVAADTRTRVLAAVTELGYRRNRVAAALRSGSSGLVGLVLPDTVNPYFAALGRELEEALAVHGKLTVIANSGHNLRRQTHATEGFLAAQVDGLIIVSAAGDGPAGPLPATHPPVVYVHHRPPGSATTLIEADNEAGVVAAVGHLRGHGHERIDLLTGPNDDGPLGTRVAAWRASASGRLLRCECTPAAAARLFAGLREIPRALITATDMQAIGVLAAARSIGTEIPRDLAVISCDGSPGTEFSVPPLTVLEQPLAAMARRAVRQLLSPPDSVEPLLARLTTRHSCGCPHPGFP